MRVTPKAFRAARAILQWPQDDLAAKAGVGAELVKAAEAGMPVDPSMADALASAFSAAGVELLGPPTSGARLAPPASSGLHPDELHSSNDG